MKRFLLTLGLVLPVFLLRPSQSRAQVHVQVNIGAQPIWGPVGYDYAEYYYMPDIDVFYDVPRRVYIYFNASRWISSPYLPDCYRDYDLYRGYKVVINEPNPWNRWDFYRRQYAGYRGWYGRQPVIRDCRDPRYYSGPYGQPYYGGNYPDRDDRYGGRYERDERWRRRDRDDRFGGRYDRDDDRDGGRGRGHAYGRYKNKRGWDD